MEPNLKALFYVDDPEVTESFALSSFDRDQIGALSTFFFHYTNLTNVQLYGVPDDYDWDDIGHHLGTYHTRLQVLKISNSILDSQLSRLLPNLLQLPYLHSLILPNNSLAMEKEVAIELGKFTALTQLSLNSNRLYEKGITNLSQNLPGMSSLNHLSLNGVAFANLGCPAIAKALQGLPQLTFLDLRFCEIRGEGFVSLAPAIGQLFNLVDLCLSANPIGASLNPDDIFPPFLQHLTCLKSLLLRNCHINKNYFPRLMDQLSLVSSLTEISLSQNILTDLGCKDLAERGPENLAYLHLEDNGIRSDGIEYLGPYLKRCTGLTYLDLCRNSVQAAGMQALAKYLPDLPLLEDLFLTGTYTENTEIYKALSQCVNLVLFDSTQQTLPLGNDVIQQIMRNRIRTSNLQSLAVHKELYTYKSGS